MLQSYKKHRGDHHKTHSTDLSPGQVFCMDIGFIRGPSNLVAVLARTEDAAPKVIESRQGYVCYLLIIDNKSRYVWVFPMKSKSVPLTLLKTFLTIHGNHNSINRRIRTDGEGSLAESSSCRTLLNMSLLPAAACVNREV